MEPAADLLAEQLADLPGLQIAVQQGADPPAGQFAELADPFVGQIAAAPIDRMVVAHRLLPSHPTEQRQRVRREYELDTRVSWN